MCAHLQHHHPIHDPFKSMGAKVSGIFYYGRMGVSMKDLSKYCDSRKAKVEQQRQVSLVNYMHSLQGGVNNIAPTYHHNIQKRGSKLSFFSSLNSSFSNFFFRVTYKKFQCTEKVQKINKIPVHRGGYILSSK